MDIDVHGHLSPPGDRGGPPGLRDPEAAIARKRALGIGTTVIGSPVGAGSMRPAPGEDNHAQTAAQVRRHNEAMLDLVARHPDALRTYAYLDPFGGEAMLAQAQELLREPGCVGLIANTSVNGRYLDAPEAEPFFAMAAEEAVPVLLHPPAVPVGGPSLPDLGTVEHIGRFCDVTAGVAAIVYAGWLERFPSLVLIASGAGGGLALLGEKLDLAARTPGARGPGGPPPSEQLRRIRVDTATPSPQALRAAVDFFGADRVLLGTDAPPLLDEAERVTRLLDGLPAGQRDQIGRGNAAALFRLGPDDAAGRRRGAA
ncbi:amidohydrolase family protein [Nocardiopsis sp. RSe5-2]|uniref:Amidohydrolase family protein n=1 Tax=Nocardiopsis endophytica TaxID=3018445 RepID=A0ABT4U8C9_9ACTN|nr:amidohydrolase family protein [Nocardiopsis endophytica]MDA2812976.1 amidohydrolase family protein [Nocardiopsis endophytica]